MLFATPVQTTSVTTMTTRGRRVARRWHETWTNHGKRARLHTFEKNNKSSSPRTLIRTEACHLTGERNRGLLLHYLTPSAVESAETPKQLESPIGRAGVGEYHWPIDIVLP